ncbi:MAG: formate dehydrogenase [Rubrivivax sp.]
MSQDSTLEMIPTGPSPALSRRTVFAGAGVAAAAAAAVALLPRLLPNTPAAAATGATADAATADEHGRYQATAHVQHYYRTTRV